MNTNTPKRRKELPRIKLLEGRYYAHEGRGNGKARRLLLVPAINFCRVLNNKRKAPR